jgi:uncharacterized protein YwqG
MKTIWNAAALVAIAALAFTLLQCKSKDAHSQSQSQGIGKHLDFLNTLKLPAIALAASSSGGLSRIGGLPSLPDEVPWPEWKGKPLAFLCQLNLAEIPESSDRQGLPRTGMLYFFYDQEQETWGFDPKDRGSWRVIHVAAAPTTDVQRAAPPGLPKEAIYKEKRVSFTPVQTYPDLQDARVSALDLSDEQWDEYTDLCAKVFGDAPRHHLFGYPSPVQGNDMDLECQLVSHGLYCGDGTGYQSTKAKELEAGRSDWMLLFQLDTDDDTEMMWGDCGMLYFWIRKEDLKAGLFDNCWMLLQCG